MPHHTELLGTIAAGLTAAFILGAIAWKLGLPLIVGYLAAGIAVGPFTPGYVADSSVAAQLAEVGVILLMFGVGLHFSVNELLAVRRLAVPGAVGQVAIATALGMALAWIWGWDLGAGLVLGLALSVASTVVLIRALSGAGLLDSTAGRIAIGWLIVEDLLMVVALVLLPSLGTILSPGSEQVVWSETLVELSWTVIKIGAFVATMLIVGKRFVPYIFQLVADTGSRELFILAVLVSALGVSYIAAVVFDVSFALGAFIAGLVVSASPLSHRAAEDALPLREAFAVLFFVSVGMLLDPAIFTERPVQLLSILGVVLVAKATAAMLLVRILGGSVSVGLTVAAGLSQVGEFSFILADMGFGLDLLPDEGRTLILGAAVVSISVNPLLFAAAQWLRRRLDAAVVLDAAGRPIRPPSAAT